MIGSSGIDSTVKTILRHWAVDYPISHLPPLVLASYAQGDLNLLGLLAAHENAGPMLGPMKHVLGFLQYTEFRLPLAQLGKAQLRLDAALRA